MHDAGSRTRRRHRAKAAVIGLGLLMVAGAPAAARDAEGWALEAELRPAGYAPIGALGERLVRAGDLAAVAAPRDFAAAPQGGAVYPMRRAAGQWLAEPPLRPEAARPGDFFGAALAIDADGSRLAIGAPGRDGGRGIVVLYERRAGAWLPETTIEFDAPGMRFGTAVAIAGDLLLVGSGPLFVTEQEVRVLRRLDGTWVPAGTLHSGLGTNGSDDWGRAMAMRSGMIVIAAPGAPTATPGAFGRVAVVVERGDRLVIERWLEATMPGGQFGTALALDAGRLAVGQPAAATGGVVQLFDAVGAWPLQATIAGAATEPGDRFGAALGFAGDRLLVGAPEADPPPPLDGWVHAFRLIEEAWVEGPAVPDPEPLNSGSYGAAIALEGDEALIGAPAANAGRVAVAVADGPGWQTAPAPLPRSGSLLAFGAAIDLDGERLLVGMTGADPDHAEDAGAGLVFRRTGEAWIREGTLLSPAPEEADALGRSVAFLGALAALGAPFDSLLPGDHRGAVRVYRRSGTAWSFRATLLAPGGQALDAFGSALAASGSRLAASAPFGDNGGIDRGVVHLYALDGAGDLVHEAWVAADDGAVSDLFGNALDLEGDVLAVGAPQHDAGATNAGAVSIFRNSALGWAFEAKLLPPVPQSQARFGSAVALIGEDLVAVGSPARNGSFADDGAIDLFRRDGDAWIHLATLAAPEPEPDGRFGAPLVATGTGTGLAIGAAGEEDEAGRVWILDDPHDPRPENLHRLARSPAWPDARFGSALAFAAGRLAVGAPSEGMLGDDSGAVALFAAQCPHDLDGDGAVGLFDLVTVLAAWGACPESGPCVGDLDGSGSVDAGDLALLLAAWGPCG